MIKADLSAQQRAALVALWLLTEGPLTVAEVAERLYETKSSAWRLLNDIGEPLQLVNDGGWWYVELKNLSNLRRLHELTGAELAAAHPSQLYARPFKRAEVEALHRCLGELLRLGLPAAQSDPVTVEVGRNGADA